MAAELREERLAANLFIQQYGVEFVVEANKICRTFTLDMMRLIHSSRHNDEEWEDLTYRNLNYGANMRYRYFTSLSKHRERFGCMRVLAFKKMMRLMDSLCAAFRKQPLAPWEFVKGCELGRDLDAYHMQIFWICLWLRLPERWRTREFSWQQKLLSDVQLPFFVWNCRPELKRSALQKQSPEKRKLYHELRRKEWTGKFPRRRPLADKA